MKRFGIIFCLTVTFILMVSFVEGSAGRPGGVVSSGERLEEVQSVRFSADDLAVFEKVMMQLEPFREESMQVRILVAARAMLGTPYVAGTLEHTKEVLTVSLAGTDCILLVEACVCMALTAGKEDRSFNAFCNNLLQLRYRNGMVDGYSSRIHYTSEWILQAEDLGLAKEISCSAEGIPLVQEISYMSTHANQYPALASDWEMTERITYTEQQLEQKLRQKGSCFIPKENLDKGLDWILPGDMICFVTRVKGLDISHVAFAWGSGSDGLTIPAGGLVTKFLHASSAEKKVVVDKKTIKEYAAGIKSCTGIRVVRFGDETIKKPVRV